MIKDSKWKRELVPAVNGGSGNSYFTRPDGTRVYDVRETSPRAWCACCDKRLSVADVCANVFCRMFLRKV